MEGKSSTLLAMIIGICGSVLIAKPSILCSLDGAERKCYFSYFFLVPVTGSVIQGIKTWSQSHEESTL